MINTNLVTYLKTAIEESLAEVGIILASDALENRFQELSQLIIIKRKQLIQHEKDLV